METRPRRRRPGQAHHRRGRVGDAGAPGGGVSMEARLRHPSLGGISLEGTSSGGGGDAPDLTLRAVIILRSHHG